MTGHFGEWLQGKLGPEGPVALISVPFPQVWCEVTVEDAEVTSFVSHGSALQLDHVQKVLELLEFSKPVRIAVNATIPPRAGLGASTASLLALVRALSGDAITPEKAASLCVSVEGATDPLMFEGFDNLLWASRQADCVERLPLPPSFEIIGGLFGEGHATDPSDNRFPDVRDLVEAWTVAASRKDRGKIAEIASESANRTTALRGPFDDPCPDLTTSLGALGHIRAHTGSARGFLFEPGKAPDNALETLKNLGFTHVTRFTTGD